MPIFFAATVCTGLFVQARTKSSASRSSDALPCNLTSTGIACASILNTPVAPIPGWCNADGGFSQAVLLCNLLFERRDSAPLPRGSRYRGAAGIPYRAALQLMLLDEAQARDCAAYRAEGVGSAFNSSAINSAAPRLYSPW